jgi:hypothetical protein
VCVCVRARLPVAVRVCSRGCARVAVLGRLPMAVGACVAVRVCSPPLFYPPPPPPPKYIPLCLLDCFASPSLPSPPPPHTPAPARAATERRTLVEAGVVEGLRSALALHPMSSAAHAYALAAIAALAHGTAAPDGGGGGGSGSGVGSGGGDSAGDSTAALGPRLVELKADQLALDAVHRYPADPWVQHSGKLALWNLAPNSGARPGLMCDCACDCVCACGGVQSTAPASPSGTRFACAVCGPAVIRRKVLDGFARQPAPTTLQGLGLVRAPRPFIRPLVRAHCASGRNAGKALVCVRVCARA